MASSGSVDYNINANDLIKSSLRIIGVGVTGETPSSEEMADARETLNIMLKAYTAHGLHLWKRDTQSITLTSGKHKYTLGPSGDITMTRPTRVIHVSRRDSSNRDVPMTHLTIDEYWELPTKSTSDGTPVSFFYDPTLTNGTLYIWPEPDSNAASEYTLEMVFQTPIEDIDAGTNDFDVPQEWYEPLRYNLAYRLGQEYGAPIPFLDRLRRDALGMLDLVLSWDQESGSLFLEPDHQGGHRLFTNPNM